MDNSLKRISEGYATLVKYQREIEIETEIEAARQRDEKLNKQDIKIPKKSSTLRSDLQQAESVPEKRNETIVKQEKVYILRNDKTENAGTVVKNSDVTTPKGIAHIKKEDENKRQEYEKKKKEVERYNAEVEEYNNALQNSRVKTQSPFMSPEQEKVKYQGRHPYLGKDDPNMPYYQRHPAAR